MDTSTSEPAGSVVGTMHGTGMQYTTPCHRYISMDDFKKVVSRHYPLLVVSAIFQADIHSGGNVIYKYEDTAFTII